MDVAVALLFAGVVIGGIVLLALVIRGRQRIREQTIQERIALLEKGLVPAPEIDPARFETLIGLRRPASRTAARYRSAGVMIMGLGLSLVVLLAFAADIPAVALGVGGGLAVLGLAVFINGSLLSEPPPGAAEATRQSPPPRGEWFQR
jgi:hypothetical protein